MALIVQNIKRVVELPRLYTSWTLKNLGCESLIFENLWKFDYLLDKFLENYNFHAYPNTHDMHILYLWKYLINAYKFDFSLKLIVNGDYVLHNSIFINVQGYFYHLKNYA